MNGSFLFFYLQSYIGVKSPIIEHQYKINLFINDSMPLTYSSSFSPDKLFP
jgi:hypothetical protein